MNSHKTLELCVRSKEPKLLNVAFNQDQSCFAVCSDNGFRVFSTYPMEMKMERDFSVATTEEDAKKKGVISNGAVSVPPKSNGGIAIVKMLYKTNYVALVGGGKKPRFPLNKLCIWDDLKEKTSIVLNFITPILNVHLSRTHIVVILKNMALVYSFKSRPELLFSFDTLDNDYGVSDLAVSDSVSVCAFPGRAVGQIHIVDIANDVSVGNSDREKKSVSLIRAHKNAIRCICLSPSGQMIASASELGTLIRVHDTRNCSLLYEFRRGVDNAVITDMSFSPKGSKLAILSDKSTLHVFQVYGNGTQDENKTHFLKGLPIFPTYFKSTWSFVSKEVGNKNDLVNDTGTIGWADESSIVIIWKFKGIWEKFDIITNDDNRHGDGRHRWQITKEGWRSLY